MTKEDKVQVSVQINGKQGINELGKLEMEANEVKFAMKGMKKSSDEYEAATKKYNGIKTRIKGVREQLGLQGMTLQQLRRYQRDLTREMDTGVTRGTKRYAELNRKIIAVNRQITRQRAEMRGATGLWNSLGKQVKQFGALALGYLGITALTSQITNLIAKSGDLSDALASVSKTTGLTAAEVDDLNSQLKKLDTRTARKELLAMAKIAGKLGITAKRDVLGFISAADKINVALGEDLGAPEESMRKLGKLVETFKVKEAYGIEDALLKVGSSINHLGKSSTANEGFIVEFTKRMGGIAPLAKITIQDILGLAAASDALGLTQEVTTTALSKLFIKMTSNREVFAQYAKDVDGNTLSLEQFSHLIDTDFNSAFLSLLRGVNDNSEGMIALSETLTDLELDGGRVVQVLGTLSNNTKLIGEQQKISNDEFTKGTSVLNEYNLMNETFGATLDKIRKALFAKFVNTSFIKGIEHLARMLGDWIIPNSETALDRTRKLRAEMNLELEALKSGNFSASQRARIIDSINKKYKDYLPNLISEKDSIEDISKLQNQANKNLLAKMLLMERETEINKLLKEQFKAEEALWALERKRQDLIINQPKDDAQALKSQLAIIDQAKKLNQVIVEATPQKLEEAKAKFDKIAKQMGTTIDGVLSKISGSSNLDNAGSTTSKSKEPKTTPQEQFTKQLTEEYRKQTIALKEARGEDLLTEEQYKADLLAMEMTHLTAMIELKKLLGKDTISEEEALADKKIEAIRRVEKAEQDALSKSKEGNKERVILIEEGIQSLSSSMSNVFGSLASLSDQSTEQGIQNALRLSNMQVIASQTAALASAIQGATAAAAATGPGAPFVLAGYIASMLATVIGAFAQIKQNQKSASDAKQSLRDKNNNSGRGYYHGGSTGPESNPGLGFGDKYGEYKGYVHADEQVLSARQLARGPQVVIPTYSTQPNKVVDLSAINSTAAAGGRFGEPTSSADQSGMAERMEQAALRNEQATEQFGQWVSVLLSKPLKSDFSRKAYRDATEDYQEKIKNQSKGSLR